MRLFDMASSNGVNSARRDEELCSSGCSKTWSVTACGQEQDTNVLQALQARGSQGYQRPAIRRAMLPFICLLLILLTCSQPASARAGSQQADLLSNDLGLHVRQTNQTAPLLECLQVGPPVLSPTSCQQTLMVYTFGSSYGQPFVGQYTPPPCSFNRVTINFTVTSAGRQFDRLALMFFNDTEIFRTSTAEPTANGIIWSYVKDMSNYLALFNEPQKIIFDLGNIVNDIYTGSWDTTLTANFFTAEDTVAADLIIPVSAQKSASDQSSAFVVPESRAINSLTMPQNVKKAVFSIAACGQATEEFWWANVLSSDTTVFGNDTTLYGYSPFRELQLYIDGTLAGVAWPFPVIFTGGIVPGFWRPVVGIDAFDLIEDEIDISAFLGVLSDGKAHTFEIRVAGISDDGQGNGDLTDTVGSNWVVTGKVFVWLDSDGSVTKGTVPTISAPAPVLDVSSSVQKGANGTVKSLDYSVKASRRFSISSTIETSEGSESITWSQDLTFWLDGQLTNGGNDQSTSQSTTGKDSSSAAYSKSYDYPLQVISSYNVLVGGNYTIDGKMGRGKYVTKVGDLAFPSEADTFDYSLIPGVATAFKGEKTSNWQNGSAHYLAAPALKKSFASGTTEQLYSLSGTSESSDMGVDLYRRHIIAANDSIVYDQEDVGGSSHVSRSHASAPADQRSFAKFSIKAMLGRGPF